MSSARPSHPIAYMETALYEHKNIKNKKMEAGQA
jgi:hypothetical protein